MYWCIIKQTLLKFLWNCISLRDCYIYYIHKHFVNFVSYVRLSGACRYCLLNTVNTKELEYHGIVLLLPAGATYFSLLQSVQTFTESQPASYEVCIAGCFSVGKMKWPWSWPITFHLIQSWRTNGAIGLPVSCHGFHSEKFTGDNRTW
jgi:hypothetical protein